MSTLSLAQASQIVDASLAKARELNTKPMTVAVLDAGGHLLAFKREDQSSILRPQIAHAKAWGAIGMGMGGRSLAERAASHPAFMNALSGVSEGRIAPVPGGLVIRDEQGATIGSIGISGDLPDRDEACAIAGVESVGGLKFDV